MDPDLLSGRFFGASFLDDMKKSTGKTSHRPFEELEFLGIPT